MWREGKSVCMNKKKALSICIAANFKLLAL